VQYPWEKVPQRQHNYYYNSDGTGSLPPFYLDVNLTTNANFHTFMQHTGYRPRDSANLLKHWKGGEWNLHPTPGTEEQPVRWVGIEDARAYCAWRGARLPQDYEWQLAAQGPDVNKQPARMYPWGDQPPDFSVNTTLVPTPIQTPPFTPANVGAHPSGVSVYGINDMAGLLWQWTSEFSDDHTRGAILRGGSSYQPAGLDQYGDNWYFPGGKPYFDGPLFNPFGSGTPWGRDKYPSAYSVSTHAKLLLMAPSLDRSGGIGFRCAADVAKPPNECHPSKTCNVCAKCCNEYIDDGPNCDKCVDDQCH
jgi:gamma-glutamyl hercynylcysteine S-oxide synthase